MAHNVFISYSSSDKDEAQKIVDFLEAKGIPCFIAHRDIPKGVEFACVIPNAIESSKCFIAVHSENFNQSIEVERELKIAADKKLKMIPFRIDRSEFINAKKYYLSNINWIDLSEDQNYNILLSSVKVALSLPLSHPAEEKKPTVLFIAAAFIILFFAGFIHAHIHGLKSENLFNIATRKVQKSNKSNCLIFPFSDEIIVYDQSSNSIQTFANNQRSRQLLAGNDHSTALEAKIGYVGIGVLLSKVFTVKVKGKNVVYYYVGATVAIIGGYGLGYYFHERFFPPEASNQMKKFLLQKNNWVLISNELKRYDQLMDFQ